MAKSRYEELLKVKKQKLTEIENQLLDVRNRKRVLEKKLKKAEEEIKEYSYPDRGNFSKMQLSRVMLSSIIRKRDEIKCDIEVRERQIEGLELLYKDANIEYEKVLYLHKEDLKAIFEKIKRQEIKEMDEVANTLFEKKRKKDS